MRPEIQSADQRGNLLRRTIPSNQAPGCRSLVTREEGSLAKILSGSPGGASRKLIHEFRKRLDGGLITFRVEGEGSLVRFDLDASLLENIAGIHLLTGDVPGHAVRPFLVQQCPGRGMGSGVSRQGSIMVVNRLLARQCQNLVIQNVLVNDAKQIIERSPTQG